MNFNRWEKTQWDYANLHAKALFGKKLYDTKQHN